jgi:hypothetical protein
MQVVNDPLKSQASPFRLACNSGQLVYCYAPTPARSTPTGNSPPNLYRAHFPSDTPTRGSSTFITRVMSLFGSNDLSVFFCFRLKLSSYEALFYSPTLSSGSLALRRVPRSHRGGLCFRARRHFRTSPSNHSGGLLLWLCTVENVGRLYQNVRAAQVRLALVGRHLCKAAHDHSHRKVRRGPQAAASSPRGARLKSMILEARK